MLQGLLTAQLLYATMLLWFIQEAACCICHCSIATATCTSSSVTNLTVLTNPLTAVDCLQVDRLILELKLPPRDAYFKLQHSLEEVSFELALQ
jgi:hypothetical protein